MYMLYMCEVCGAGESAQGAGAAVRSPTPGDGPSSAAGRYVLAIIVPMLYAAMAAQSASTRPTKWGETPNRSSPRRQARSAAGKMSATVPMAPQSASGASGPTSALKSVGVVRTCDLVPPAHGRARYRAVSFLHTLRCASSDIGYFLTTYATRDTLLWRVLPALATRPSACPHLQN